MLMHINVTTVGAQPSDIDAKANNRHRQIEGQSEETRACEQQQHTHKGVAERQRHEHAYSLFKPHH